MPTPMTQQEFGIYDDDPQIEKLMEPEFSENVRNSDQRWFVNFFATGTSHAPPCECPYVRSFSLTVMEMFRLYEAPLVFPKRF